MRILLITTKFYQYQNRVPIEQLFSVETLSLYPYKVCKELGIKIPDQLKFVSFSNMDAASFLVPSLTTITQPAFEIGKAAATALFQQLEKKKKGLLAPDTVLPSTLIVRESSVKK